MSFICHIHNYTEYNEEWNVFSAFNPTWSSGQPTVQRPGSSRGLPVRDGIRTHNLGLPQISSPTLYPLGQRLPNSAHNSDTVHQLTSCEVKRYAFVRNKSIIKIEHVDGADSLVVSVLTYSAVVLTATRVWFLSWGPLLTPLPALFLMLSCHLSTVLSTKSLKISLEMENSYFGQKQHFKDKKP